MLSDALKYFEDAYAKASASSLPNDWLDAALLGKQLANALRAQADAQLMSLYQCLSSSGEWVNVSKEFWESATGTKRRILPNDPAPEAAQALSDVPLGAIENGRALADRLEAYPFESQGGDLKLCSDWQELRRCFEHLAEWALTRASAATVAEQLAASQQPLGAEFDRVLRDSLPDLYIEDGATVAEPSDGLDFTPDEHHTIADMANVGYALMQAIKANRPDYAWNESPAEIVVDLINEAEEIAQQQAEPVGDERAAGELPELPQALRYVWPEDDECSFKCHYTPSGPARKDGTKSFPIFTAEQMQEYARAALAAQSGQRAGVAEGFTLMSHERNLLLSIAARLEAGNEKKAIHLEQGSARVIRALLDRAAAPMQQERSE